MVILETERLLFRPHEPDDMEAFCDMEADPEVRRYVGGRPRPRNEAEARFRRELAGPIVDRLSLWATVYKTEGRYIGRCGVYPHFNADGSHTPGEGVLAFYLARPYWGRGLATEAGRAWLRFGFTELGLARIVASVQAGNQASVRVMERLGLRYVRTEQGEYCSFLHYEMVREEMLY